jgi:hypothetical protein
MKITKEQQRALRQVFERTELDMTYLQFRRTALRGLWDECVMVPWCGMLLGIERDGYTHS